MCGLSEICDTYNNAIQYTDFLYLDKNSKKFQINKIYKHKSQHSRIKKTRIQTNKSSYVTCYYYAIE